MSSRYGSLFQIEDYAASGTAKRLNPVKLTVGKTSGDYNEKWLQRFLSNHPQALPIREIEPYLDGAVPICIELNTAAGLVDLLLVSPKGDIVLVECKLWRNPQARREVVGQIIHYASVLPRLSYESFEAAICGAEPANGSTKADALYVRAGAEAAGVDEANFIDAVTRNLRRGRVLLLLVGDGIREDVETISEFLQQHAGMHFTLALVEVAIFQAPPHGFLVQPRMVMKTQMVPRGVVSIDDDRVMIGHGGLATQGRQTNTKDSGAGAKRAIPATISEARLFEALDSQIPGGAASLRQFLGALEDIGVRHRCTESRIILERTSGDSPISVAQVIPSDKKVYLDGVVSKARSLGCTEAALTYYDALTRLISSEQARKDASRQQNTPKTVGLQADDLLSQQDKWLYAIKTYLAAIDAAIDGSAPNGGR